MAEQIDFSEVALSDIKQDPRIIYRLGNGVLPEIAEAFGVELAEIPDVDNLGTLVGAIGPNKTLRDNITGVEAVLSEASLDISRDWVERSGIMAPLDRGLWNPDQQSPESSVAVLMGGVANWMAWCTNS